MNDLAKISTSSSKRNQLIKKISLGIFLFGGGGFVLYYGYCWGVWGRNSLLLQYIFQCSCPLSSNEFRYPKRVDVLVPACHDNKISLTPSGNFLFINTKDKNYTLDLRTGKTTYLPLSSSKGSHFTEMPFYFLTDTLILHSYYGVDEYIFDVTNEEKYQVQRVSNLSFENLIQNLDSAKNVFLIDNDMVVVLMHNIDSSFTFDAFYLTEDFFQENQDPFIQIYNYLDYPNEIPSFNSKFIAREDGIYMSISNEKIVDTYDNFSLFGWVFNDTGVIYAKPFGSCLIRYWFPLMDGSNCLIRVPQPVLLLKVPQEYLITSP